MSENLAELLTSESGKDNKALQEKRKELLTNTKQYVVRPRDTIASIAREHGIHDYHDLLALNRLLEKRLEASGKKGTRILIKAGDTIYLPENSEQFARDIETVKKITEAVLKNEQVAKGERAVLQKEMNERIFPRYRQSLGMHRLNEGLLGNMRASLWLPGPRQVDVSHEWEATCAHYYRQELRSTLNIADMSKSWQKFMNKKNIDAWVLPAEILALTGDNGKSEFIQKKNFMHFFDPSKIGAKDSPVSKEKMPGYIDSMVALNEYLWNNPEKTANTAIPVYYRYSNYQKRGVERWGFGENAHINTHMMRNVGNNTITFPAYDVGEVRPDGSVVSFGGDKKRLEQEIDRLRGSLSGEKAVYEGHKKNLLKYIKEEFPKHTFIIDKKITEYSKGAKTPEDRIVLKKRIETLFETGDIPTVRSELSKIIRWPVTDEDARLLIHWQKSKSKAVDSIREITSILEGKTPTQPIFELSDRDSAILGNGRLIEVLTTYNEAAKRLNGLEEQLSQAKGKIENLDTEEQNREKERKEAEEQIKLIIPELDRARKDHGQAKQALVDGLDESKNSELKKWLEGFENVAKKHFGPSGGSRADMLIQGFRSGKMSDEFRVQMRMTEEDFNYLKTIFLKREKTRKDIVSLRSRLGVESENLPQIRTEEIERAFGKNGQPLILKALSDYNTSVAKINGYVADIHVREEKMKIKKEISVVDYFLNFLQQRADYSESAMQAAGRKQILEGLTMYAGAVKFRLNGKEVDFRSELAKPKNEQIKVSPEDTIEISGPVMSDGFHIMTLKDPVEKKKMQGRQRFLFELLATQTFFPSETLEPTETSLMRRKNFREATDHFQVKGSYSLNRGETIQDGLRRMVPILEREEFEKLDRFAPDYEEKYRALLQKHYASQVKGLQPIGYMQVDEELNPGAAKINQAIPYFDSSDISSQYRKYIDSVKVKHQAANKEVAPYIEYMDVQFLPGDTYGNLFARIAKNLENYESHFDKYPNLRYLGGMNDFLKKEFLRRYVETSIQSGDSIKWQDMLDGKVKPGQKFVLHLSHMDRIIGELRNTSYTPSIKAILKPVDQEVIEMAAPFRQTRNLMERALYIESYEVPNDKWYLPDGTRRLVKEIKEARAHRSDIQKVGDYAGMYAMFSLLGIPVGIGAAAALYELDKKEVNSQGPFQERIKSLRNGYGEEWLTQKQILESLALLSRPDIQARLEEMKEESIQQDLARVERVKLIAEKLNPTPEDFQIMSELLQKIIRLDKSMDGTTIGWIAHNMPFLGLNSQDDAIVGKILGASLAGPKLNSHMGKVLGQLERSGEDMESLRRDPVKGEAVEQIVLLDYNLGENKILFGQAENYILRLMEKSGIAAKGGKTMEYPQIQTKRLTGSMVYGVDTFIDHIIKMNEGLGFDKLGTDKNQGPELIISKYIREFVEKITEASKQTDRGRREAMVQNAIYELTSNKELRNTLDTYVYDPSNPRKRISSSLLPSQEEIGSNSFSRTFFQYVRKGEEAEKIALEKEREKEREGDSVRLASQ